MPNNKEGHIFFESQVCVFLQVNSWFSAFIVGEKKIANNYISTFPSLSYYDGNQG